MVLAFAQRDGQRGDCNPRPRSATVPWPPRCAGPCSNWKLEAKWPGLPLGKCRPWLLRSGERMLGFRMDADSAKLIHYVTINKRKMIPRVRFFSCLCWWMSGREETH